MGELITSGLPVIRKQSPVMSTSQPCGLCVYMRGAEASEFLHVYPGLLERVAGHLREGLLVSQGDHRIHAHCAARRDVTSREHHECEQDCCTSLAICTALP